MRGPLPCLPNVPPPFPLCVQYFTATPGSKFEALVREWEAGGLVTRWPEPFVGRLSVGGPFVPFTDSIARFIGVGGFRPLCDYLADRSRVVRPQWVGEMKPVELGRWQLAKGPGGKPIGLYDFVAISHNGKCAARLAGTAKWSDGSGAADKVGWHLLFPPLLSVAHSHCSLLVTPPPTSSLHPPICPMEIELDPLATPSPSRFCHLLNAHLA